MKNSSYESKDNGNCNDKRQQTYDDKSRCEDKREDTSKIEGSDTGEDISHIDCLIDGEGARYWKAAYDGSHARLADVRPFLRNLGYNRLIGGEVG